MEQLYYTSFYVQSNMATEATLSHHFALKKFRVYNKRV